MTDCSKAPEEPEKVVLNHGSFVSVPFECMRLHTWKRSGFVMRGEIHMYESDANVCPFCTNLGKIDVSKLSQNRSI